MISVICADNEAISYCSHVVDGRLCRYIVRNQLQLIYVLSQRWSDASANTLIYEPGLTVINKDHICNCRFFVTISNCADGHAFISLFHARDLHALIITDGSLDRPERFSVYRQTGAIIICYCLIWINFCVINLFELLRGRFQGYSHYLQFISQPIGLLK